MIHILQDNRIAQRTTRAIVEGHREHLQQLNTARYKTSRRLKDAGILIQLKIESGGHYFPAWQSARATRSGCS